ncbi:MAG: AMP-binding protein, partial [bacterium]|nr:AMP-binding protein [bacterium]
SRQKAPHIHLKNEYGPTEATVTAVAHGEIDPSNTAVIGKPIANTTVYIFTPGMGTEPAPPLVPGELCISGPGIAGGYLNNPELTAEKFIENPFKNNSRIYRTGDLARWLPGGNLEFLGRIDRQIKIAGYRIEPEEISCRLSTIANILENLVTEIKDQHGQKHLCAYFVSQQEINITELRATLACNLPPYMIPSYFKQIDSIPLTANGKINMDALPLPSFGGTDDLFTPPTGEVQLELARIWSEVLGLDKDKISADANFFELGGDSLRATILISKIHKTFNTKISFIEIFETPTIKDLERIINESSESVFSSIERAEKKEYYQLSSAQKRMYVLQQIEPGNTGYNAPETMYLDTGTCKEKLQNTFKALIQRHESLRTSLFMVNSEPVQKIHPHVEFEIEYYDLSKEPQAAKEQRNAVTPAPGAESLKPETLEASFVRPFDLAAAPLFRARLIRTPENCTLLMDTHHIISDAVSRYILEEEFHKIYSGEQLPELPLQYKDYAHWQNSRLQQEAIKTQQDYWLKVFPTADEIPILNLPTDFKRPLMQSFQGCSVGFALNHRETATIKDIAKELETTLFMVILSIYHILLSKLSEQPDTIVGTPIAARSHSDLERIIGMFVNTLALRNPASGDKTWKEFVADTKTRTLEAFQNQDYQFEDLVEQLAVKRDVGRNPLFDVVFSFFKQEEGGGETIDHDEAHLNVHKKGISKFDMTLRGMEMGEDVYFSIEYCSKLFKPRTIDRFISYFKEIIAGLP